MLLLLEFWEEVQKRISGDRGASLERGVLLWLEVWEVQKKNFRGKEVQAWKGCVAVVLWKPGIILGKEEAWEVVAVGGQID